MKTEKKYRVVLAPGFIYDRPIEVVEEFKTLESAVECCIRSNQLAGTHRHMVEELKRGYWDCIWWDTLPHPSETFESKYGKSFYDAWNGK